MKLDLDDPYVFDKWRENYSVMTNQEHLEFCNRAEARFPSQQHFTASNFEALFRDKSPWMPRVLEIGGWKGELAQHCSSRFEIESWLNVDFCVAALQKTVDMGDFLYRYGFSCPDTINWFNSPRIRDYEVCISSHTIEHLSDEHLLQLIDYISGIPMVMFEAPIGDVENDWRGYLGTHILKMGWNGVNEAMSSRGYEVERINEFCFFYSMKKIIEKNSPFEEK
jgi:hypothetical protein